MGTSSKSERASRTSSGTEDTVLGSKFIGKGKSNQSAKKKEGEPERPPLKERIKAGLRSLRSKNCREMCKTGCRWLWTTLRVGCRKGCRAACAAGKAAVVKELHDGVGKTTT